MATQYIFFDATLRDRFMAFAAARNLAASSRPDAIAGHVVELTDDLDDDVGDALESEYDALMNEQMDLVNADDDADARDVMGVAVTLPDGTDCTVRLPPTLARRLLQAFAPDELREVVEAIAASVANPKTGPICRDI
jgi:hypothetical protein